MLHISPGRNWFKDGRFDITGEYFFLAHKILALAFDPCSDYYLIK